MLASESDDLTLEAGAEPIDAGDAEPWRMLHPASLLVNLVPRAWAVVRQLWPFLLVAIAGETAGGQSVFDLSFIVFFFLIAVANTVVHFATLRYRVAGGRLEIRSGLLSTNRRVVAPRAVQNIELVRNIFHRAAGLVEVRIETASGEEVEGLLSALTVEEGNRLVAALSRARRAAPQTDVVPVLAHNDLNDLVLFGAAGTRVGAALMALGLLTDWAGLLDPKGQQDLGRQFGLLGMALLFLALLGGAWVFGILSAVIRHHGFTLSLSGDALVSEEGFFTRRRVELPRHKVQLVDWSEPWIRRLFGFGSMTVESASTRAGVGGTERSLAFVPVIRPDDALHLVGQALPGLDVPMDASVWSRADVRARTRALAIGAVQSVMMWVAAAVMGFGWASALLVLGSVLPVVSAWFDWSAPRWAVSERYVVSRRGFFDRQTIVVARDRIQSVQIVQGPILVQMGLAQIVLRVAGSAVLLPMLDADAAVELANLLSFKAGRS